MRCRGVLFLLALFAFINVFQTRAYCQDTEHTEEPAPFYDDQTGDMEADMADPVYYRGKVLEALEVVEYDYDYAGFSSNIQLLEVIVTKGPYKGEIFQAEYALNYGFDGKYQAALLSKGDEVILLLPENEFGQVEAAHVIEVARDKYLLYLVICFMALLLLVGRMKGLKAIVSLILTVFAIFKVLLPVILQGGNPILVSIPICVSIIAATLIIIGGLNTKTFAAILGTAGGVAVAGVIALVVGSMADLTGLGNNEAQMLMYIPQDIYFNFRGLLFSGILIGAMGAVMDVGMSIASAMHEIKQNSPDIGDGALLKAGMNVGRDAMGTMSNTLILAYVGSSMQMILLFMAYNYSLSTIINWDVIASEIARALAGSIGIIVAIPLTAVSSVLIEKFQKNNSL